MRHIKYKEDNNLENQNPINMKDLDKVMNELNLCEITSEDLGLIRRYLERLILIIERSRIREYMMLTDSKRRLFLINFVAGLGKGFGQAIGFTVLAALVLYLLSTWVDLPVIGAFIAKLINIVNKYKEKLLKEKEKLTGLISEMRDNTVFGNITNHTSERYTSGELSSYDNHPADIGTEVYMQDMQNSLTNHEEGKLNNIEDALYKIENGTYGICDICHQQIDKDRLDILPETNLCSNCAKNQPDLHLTSREENQRLINKGYMFYDETVMKLNEMNKMPKDESDRD